MAGELVAAFDPSGGLPIVLLIIAVTGVLKQAICGSDRARANRFGRLIALVVACVLLVSYELYQGSGIYRDFVATLLDALAAMGIVYAGKRAPGVVAVASQAARKSGGDGQG